jgi:nitroimidazol reductase NimA-like FMN-containing flavoprotein (pyridoxamine 5'-phosphate oxidase superfamily)
MENKNIAAMEAAYNKRLERDFVEKLKRKTKKLSKDELQERIIKFMDDHCICTLATCSDNIPRSTVLRYRSQGLAFYIFTEGGGKVKNIRANPNVSVSICGEYSGFESVNCLQTWGKAEIIKPHEKEKYEKIKKFISLGQRQDIKDAGIREIPDMYLLKIDITRARFLSFPEGILNQVLDV